jgi:hypothetical protein
VFGAVLNFTTVGDEPLRIHVDDVLACRPAKTQENVDLPQPNTEILLMSGSQVAVKESYESVKKMLDEARKLKG